ncbi:TPA: hypothetical protein DEP96_01090 [Candidatus Uhrbacteria bacterium]|nr:hypothetical protein [Candidatus Uhrbacteria bacterium]
MKFYLSSFRLGNQATKLKILIPHGHIAYIPNALDFTNVDQTRRDAHIKQDLDSLRELGLRVETLNLHDYFGQQAALQAKLTEIGAIFVSGGNVFILRQAMKLSGLDVILTQSLLPKDVLYAGYSAAGCVLSPNLDAYKIVDDATETPYPELPEVIWTGLNLIDFAFLPHWDSDHPESATITQAVEYCQQHNLPYKTLRDGEVLIIE